MKLKNLIIQWYEEERLPRVRPTTSYTNLMLIQYHIVENPLGEMDIEDIRTNHIDQFLNQKRLFGNRQNKKGLSTSCLTKLRQYLVATFKFAIKHGYIDKNYAEDSCPIKVRYKTTRAFTLKERDLFLKKTEKTKFGFVFYLLFFTGCRRGELLGLSWDNVDFDNNTISICQSIIMFRSRPMLVEDTKNKTSKRVLPLPKGIIKKLQAWKDKQDKILKKKKIVNKYNLVFINEKGDCLNPTYVSRSFREFIKRIGFNKDFHIHSTRHTWATMMLANNVSIPDIQYLGGWSRPTVLLNIYSHVTKASHRVAMEKLFTKK